MLKQGRLYKLVTGALALGIGLLLSQSAWAGTITGSKHDFSGQSWSGGRICIVCHTPHNADTSVNNAPLWNHSSTTATYTLYNSPTLDATEAQPGESSKLCLSCHDGTVAVDSFGGASGSTTIAAAGNLGTDLSDDHPFSFTYDTNLATTDGALHDPSTQSVTIGSSPSKSGTIQEVLLYDNKMECASCHDVHNTFTTTSGFLLKVSTDGSKLCLACHNL